ncbi:MULTISPECIES: hypothetical protein [Streptomyces]|uniref:hypothetical protein n=1 Tax=Streptomyces TaxID=1883 RepID=UPI0033A1A2C0
MTVPLLFVPSVPEGDQGLVLEVNGVASEPQSRRWYVLTLEGHAFGLPARLWPWAMELDAQTRRRELMMPAVFAFRRVGETVTVERLATC